MKRFLLLVVVALILVSGCSNPQLKTYVKADRMTYEAVSPDYLQWLAASKLKKDQKERRQRLISSWLKRIEGAEKGK